MDFSKIIEIFDEHNASFVSITQHFNTTTSMGRLTLNILLSFAQFERELLEASPQDILDKSYEYISKRNIVTEIEYGRNLSNEQLKAMLKLKAPLEVLYEEWIDTDGSESQMIREFIYDFSKEEAERIKEKEKNSRDER